jgi:tRNA threonylcarbamoyladenosine biosynthesis protein TsaE
MVKRYKVSKRVIPRAIEEILGLLNSPNGIFLLDGDLASGKTTFVKEFVKYFDIDDEVTSPTFTIQHIYGTNIYHYDIYQKNLTYFIQSGLFSMLRDDGFHLIEWANDEFAKLLKMYDFKFFHIKFINSDEKYRIYQVSNTWQH